MTKATESDETSSSSPDSIYAVNRAGQIVRPHRYRDGRYRVSRTKYAVDQVPVSPAEPLTPWLTRGYHVRMSTGAGSAASLFPPDSIQGWRR